MHWNEKRWVWILVFTNDNDYNNDDDDYEVEFHYISFDHLLSAADTIDLWQRVRMKRH